MQASKHVGIALKASVTTDICCQCIAARSYSAWSRTLNLRFTKLESTEDFNFRISRQLSTKTARKPENGTKSRREFPLLEGETPATPRYSAKEIRSERSAQRKQIRQSVERRRVAIRDKVRAEQTDVNTTEKPRREMKRRQPFARKLPSAHSAGVYSPGDLTFWNK